MRDMGSATRINVDEQEARKKNRWREFNVKGRKCAIVTQDKNRTGGVHFRVRGTTLHLSKKRRRKRREGEVLKNPRKYEFYRRKKCGCKNRKEESADRRNRLG